MPRLLGKSRVWGRGYTTIPLTVRRLLAVENGDVLEWYITERGEIIIKKGAGNHGGNGL
jgi:bifunctional DNA-binding transcriptional regulator/antitoxin component of YhaV-PrlF toxin-antitoxin module